MKVDWPYGTIAEATRETQFSRSEISNRMRKKMISYYEDPTTGRRYPNIEELKRLVPRLVTEGAASAE